MSSWVTTKSAMWPALDRKGEAAAGGKVAPTAFLAHGSDDPMIDKAWGESTRDSLQQRGVDVVWFEEGGIGHEPGPKTLDRLQKWILDRLS